jgi:AcrR family transcriptional regulator
METPLTSNPADGESFQPPTPKGQRTRAQQLTAARRVFGRSGYVTFRMGDVAAEAGVSMGALYRYFENKDDVFLSLIGDIHEELFTASRARGVDFGTQPYEALLNANKGYLEHYSNNRDVMRAFVEATTVDERYRKMWWWMRERHIDRFVTLLANKHGITQVNGTDVRYTVEALASLTEQSAYCWFAQEQLNKSAIPHDTAAEVITRAWYNAFFPSSQASAS